MIERFRRSCQALLSPDKSYLVALSGGADSVALVRLLVSQNYKISAAHCNFHLRGEESDRDEAFCKNLCSRLGVPLHLAHFDTKAFAELHGVSIEMAARTLRYDYFFKLLDDLHLDAVCVAHHKDDSVETVLLNMVRGTGIDGLKGILPENGKVLRPMLGVSRSEIIDYLSSVKQDFATDSSNLVDDVQRNKIRLNVIPELLKVNPSAVENIHRMSSRIQDAMAILDKAIEEATKRIAEENEQGELSVSIPLLMQEPGRETLLWNLLKSKGFSSLQVEQIAENLSGQSGREWSSASHSLLIDRDVILVQKKVEEQVLEMKIPETGTYIFDENTKFRFKVVDKDADFQIIRDANCACLDAEKVKFPLTVRRVKNGDWFIPFGMTGKKLLSDFLTDKKFTIFEKRRQLVVTDCEGNIIWVSCLRPDNRFRLDDSTSRVLLVEKI